MESIWESTTDIGVRKWIIGYLLPSLLLLGFVTAVYIYSFVGLQAFWTWWQGISNELHTTFVALFFMAALVIAVILDALEYPLLRWTEGYWANIPLVASAEKLRYEHYRRYIGRAHEEYSQLAQLEAASAGSSPPFGGEHKKQRLEQSLHYFPPKPDRALPTLLGNIIRAGEDHVLFRYGLDAVATWMRLYPNLGTELRTWLEETRSSLDLAIRFVYVARLCALLTLVLIISQSLAQSYTISSLLTLLAILIGAVTMCILFYQWALRSARVYSDLLRVAFDLHRFDLYHKLHIPLPEVNGPDEVECGQRLSEFLWRGTTVVRYAHPEYDDLKK